MKLFFDYLQSVCADNRIYGLNILKLLVVVVYFVENSGIESNLQNINKTLWINRNRTTFKSSLCPTAIVQ